MFPNVRHANILRVGQFVTILNDLLLINVEVLISFQSVAEQGWESKVFLPCSHTHKEQECWVLQSFTKWEVYSNKCIDVKGHCKGFTSIQNDFVHGQFLKYSLRHAKIVCLRIDSTLASSQL
ncbi:uncharacterized protein BJ171DRAFT_566157 [Polychytrium aggregatum]|uniref:uncharacterized protein n=1 Tax=Polychytrium aggregatum TaxID=110093 RepID=UPI0022FDEA0B|nr:uncharacterized protein BJ171DRAFT_566155 [Polychytrium aggregatum]XP_052969450.1 uncharacterized protein BJ171DRAFT_566156 [Polychytrium aggregatum]XP_052969452.1 uncharacterized protein BJ171DRAFT_566157 [Polychytrium aggregatum]KAI9207369.1 hypothetical protein BJ171DRAFT_566155 [Polychytrium aggregatum]KAI9207370.1 hypothetical protein BJ171DRAFT_566156 [Polychytrium aggregatum]KAI9207372.1 hypothetical protein BJ171DRAFT_566157 [Polychytrium aggregatum]